MCAITIPLLLVFTSYSLPLSHVSAANPSSSPLSWSGSQGVTHHHSLFHWTLCRFPSELQFHISSRKMPALTVAGSRLKKSGAPCHRQAYLQQNALKGEELAMHLLEATNFPLKLDRKSHYCYLSERFLFCLHCSFHIIHNLIINVGCVVKMAATFY